ncbi:glycoside hydrolase family 17 protein [[Candida] arabinofermentans NRRL YB-2248]|uniref:Glycoside hydrolase family 17 protein n=1 Tax=[Candida] arabinofermentans NRRL YB-2248 TaxID=983967 RepID=A0A1E4SUH8_9ASCO|nr:glycoside hydrolase family 17 protein [[Candida] arabinofermentans NRRL YB-2248]
MLFKNIIKSLAASSLIAQSLAQPVAHLHHQHAKRGVVVVTETVVVTVNAGDESAQTSTINYVHADTSVTAAEADSTSTTAAQVVPTTTTSATKEEEEKTTTTSSSSSSSTAAAATETSSSSSSDFGAGAKGITYSPYTSSGACKTLDEVKTDLAELTDYSVIRLYGVDCNQVENVMQAKADGQKLFLGIYFMDAITSAVEQISDAVDSYGSWDDITTVSVGNELVNSGSATTSQVKAYISEGRAALKSAGYTGSVVSVDTHVAIINNPELCEYSDYIAFNAHSYWDGTIYPSGAGDWLLLQMQRVWSACGGEKTVLCSESGWPTKGDTYGVAVPSEANQATAISSIESSCGDSTILFTAFNDLWKSPGDYGVEQYWGIV